MSHSSDLLRDLVARSLQRRPTSLTLLLDLNQTLIRTGELTPGERIRETRQLSRFAALCRQLDTLLDRLELVFVTGNSFEYSRRIEEPLGLKHGANTELIVISENGLIGRSFRRGDLWREEPLPEYWEAVDGFMRRLNEQSDLRGTFYSQGNEVRRTLKPIADRFDRGQIALLDRIRRDHLEPGVARSYLHEYYLDIDPARVLRDGEPAGFGGKGHATERLLSSNQGTNALAIGDSESDLPMFEAVTRRGGAALWVANARCTGGSSYPVLNEGFCAGVNEALTIVAEELSGDHAHLTSRSTPSGTPSSPAGR